MTSSSAPTSTAHGRPAPRAGNWRSCAAYDLAYIEQPLELDDLHGHVELRRCQTRSCRAGRERLHAVRRRQHRARISGGRRAARSARGRGTVADRESRRHLRGGRAFP